MDVKGGVFQFECPRCKALLEVPYVRKKFKCPNCNSAYGINLHVEEHQGEGKDMKKRTLKEELTILSKFEKCLSLEYDVKDSRCDKHEYSDATCEGKWKLLCVGCKKRLCTICSEKIHLHPELKDHITMPRSHFEGAKTMFQALIRTKGQNGKIPCTVLARESKKYFKDKDLRRICQALMYKNVDKFGKQYSLDLAQFVEELGAFCLVDSQRRRGNTRTKIDPFQRGKGEIQLQAEAEMWHDLGWCGQFLYDLQFKCSKLNSRRRLRLWEESLTVVEAHLGANVASYFYFARWVFVLNLFLFFMFMGFIIIPRLSDKDMGSPNFWGLIIGKGLEESWMFYGGYMEYYFDGKYNMGAAWVIVCSAMLFFSLAAGLMNMEGGKNSNLKEDKQLAFSRLVFGGYDHHLLYYRPVKLMRLALRTSLQSQLSEFLTQTTKVEKAKKAQEKCCRLDNFINKKLFGRLFALSLAAGNIWLVYELVRFEKAVIIPQWQGDLKFILVPILIAISKLIAPQILKWIVKFEGHTRVGPELRRYFGGVMFMRMCYVLFVLFGVVNATQIESGSPEECLETAVGVVFYRLLLADVVVELIFFLLWPYFYINAARKCYFWLFPVPEDQRKWLIASDELEMDDMSNSNRSGPASRPRGASAITINALKQPAGKSEPPSPAHALAPASGPPSRPESPSPSGRARSATAVQREAQLAMERTESSYDLEQRYRDRFKKEFDISMNISDILYRQCLIWCGAPFCPMLPIIGAFSSLIIFFAKKVEVLDLSHARSPLAIARQNRFFRAALVGSMFVSLVPFTFFLRRIPNCGPHVVATNKSILDNFLASLDSLPSWMNVVINYFTSVVLLWMLLTMAVIYLLTLYKRESYLRKELARAKIRLKLETLERKKIIEVYDVKIGQNEARGKELFVEWIDELGPMGERYGPKLTALGYGDLIKLCKLNDSQIDGILSKINCPYEHIELLQHQISEKRQDLVYLTVQS